MPVKQIYKRVKLGVRAPIVSISKSVEKLTEEIVGNKKRTKKRLFTLSSARFFNYWSFSISSIKFY